MSTKSKSIQNKSSDERLRKVSKLKVLLNRPELGALGGSILVFIFLGLQACWIIPIIYNNKKLNKTSNNLREEIKKLEKLYKK